MENFKHFHFIGVGGIGISALAFMALAQGKKVTGSDANESALIADLREQGAEISIGHAAENIGEGVGVVIYTEAIDKTNNPEYLTAIEKGLFAMSYFEVLGQLTAQRKTIAVIGTHGKTTTTAMLGLALAEAKVDPLVIVGSKLPQFEGRNIRMGSGEWMVTEACEYRRSFLNIQPFGAILLNCELEHMDYYKDEEDYLDAFCEFVAKIPEDGFLIANLDDKNVANVASICRGTVIGIKEQDVERLNLNLAVPGKFNQMNAALAYHAALAAGAKEALIRGGLMEFKGTWRRMEHKGLVDGADLIDDYGHHPTEIKVTLKAIKQKYPGRRLVCVFQPHQYSRTYQLLDQFKTAFKDADSLILSDIYAVRDSEEDKAKISNETLLNTVKEQQEAVLLGGNLENTSKVLKMELKKGDVVVTMGAGSIGKLADELVQEG